MEARRFEGWFLLGELVKVDWPAGESSGSLRATEAVLEDISELGACLQVEDRIPPGTAISISVISGETVRFSGWVQYCVYRDYGYFVGIRFSKETTLSSLAESNAPATNPASYT
jgi:hypothetical protein